MSNGHWSNLAIIWSHLKSRRSINKRSQIQFKCCHVGEDLETGHLFPQWTGFLPSLNHPAQQAPEDLGEWRHHLLHQVCFILIHDEWNSETRASINQIPKIDEEGDILFIVSTLSARDSPELFVFCAWWPNLELFNCDSESRLLISLDLKTVTWF